MAKPPFNTSAVFYLVGATVLWGLNFHLAKFMLSDVSFIEAGFWRYVLGVGFLIMAQIISGKGWPGTSQLLRGFKGYFLAGFIGLFGFSFFFFLGLKYTSALNASLQVSLNPLITLVLAHWILGTPIYRHQKVGMIVAIAGVLILVTKGRPYLLLEIDWSYGDGLIFIANVLFAIQHIWVKQYNKGSGSNISFTLITNGFCLIGFLLLLPFNPITPPGQLNASFWLSAFGIGVLGTGLAYIFWNAGIKSTGAANAGLYMNIVPFATAVFAVLIGAQIAFYHLASGALILIGMVYFQGGWQSVSGLIRR